MPSNAREIPKLTFCKCSEIGSDVDVNLSVSVVFKSPMNEVFALLWSGSMRSFSEYRGRSDRSNMADKRGIDLRRP